MHRTRRRRTEESKRAAAASAGGRPLVAPPAAVAEGKPPREFTDGCMQAWLGGDRGDGGSSDAALACHLTDRCRGPALERAGLSLERGLRIRKKLGTKNITW
jgi:hypothetical protein